MRVCLLPAAILPPGTDTGAMIMTREAMERCLAKGSAQAMRAAAIRLARERAGQDADPSLAYGCVDWFHYDVISPPKQAEGAQPPGPCAAVFRTSRRGSGSLTR